MFSRPASLGGRPRAWVSLVLGVALLVAYALRVAQLGAQSLWADEGYGLYLATLPLPDLLREMLVDLNHVPMFFLTQHFWTRLAGDSEFAARYLSVAAGLVAIALTYRLGRIVASPSVGVVAAAIAVVAPFQVYYSQEARMHIWTTAIGLLAANAVLWALDKPERPARWLLFVAAGVVGLYTFYYAGFVLAAVSITAAWALAARRDWRSFGWLVAANATIALCFAPWALNLAGALGAQAEHKAKDFVAYDLPNFLNAFWKTAIAGVTVNVESLPFPIWPVALALGLGLALLWRGRYPLLLPLYLLIPLLGVYAIQARYPHFVPRYLLLATPPFYLMLAAGVVAPFGWRGWRRLTLVPVGLALATFIGATSVSLANNYFNPAYIRDDYRGVANAIRAASQPDDAIVLNAPWQLYNFPYYYPGPLPLTGLPYEDPLDPAITTPKLRALLANHAGVWLVLYGNASMDPTGYVEQWLDEHAYKVGDAWYGTIRLARYLAPVTELPARVHRTTTRYMGGLALLGYEVAGEAVSGEPLAVRLYWRAEQRLRDDYRVSVRLHDANGRVWAQTDGVPLAGAIPTTQWDVGATYRDPHRLDVPAGAPAGSYRLSVVVYSASGEAPPAGSASIGVVTIAPDPRTDRPDPTVGRRVNEPLGGLRVVGVDLPAATFLAGRPIDALVAVRGIGGGAQTVRLVVGQDGRAVAEGEPVVVPALRSGELRRVVTTVRPDGALPAGDYSLWLEADGRRVTLGPIRLTNRPRVTTVPAEVTRLDRPAGGGLVVAGATIASDSRTPGDLSVRVIWQAREAPEQDYVAFVHVVDASDRIVAQRDAPPGGPDAPTSGLIAGEIVDDRRVIALPALPPGDYAVYVGLYRPDTGQRVGPGDGRILVGVARVP